MFDVVHIGLGKCLSTTLQGLWQASPDVHCVDVRAAMPKITERLVAARASGQPVVPLEIALPPNPGRRCAVLTSEGMTFSMFSGKPHLFDLIPERQAHMARRFGALGRRVLMVVRDPYDWVRSTHAQYIKEGGTLSRGAWFEAHRAVCMHNLDLVRLLDTWRAVNPQVVVLPMPLLASDPGAFWAMYTALLQVPAPARATDTGQRNAAPYARLELAARLNGLLGDLAAIADHEDASHARTAADGFRHGRTWGVRRCMEGATDAEVDALARRIGFTPDPSFLAWTPDAAFTAFVESRFWPPLRAMPHLAGVFADDAAGQRNSISMRSSAITNGACISGSVNARPTRPRPSVIGKPIANTFICGATRLMTPSTMFTNSSIVSSGSATHRPRRKISAPQV